MRNKAEIQNDLVMLMQALAGIDLTQTESAALPDILRPLVRRAERISAGMEDEAERQERTNLAGMAHGVDAYNEAMGWDTSSPEPCGHHCVGAYPPCHCMSDDE